MMYKSFLQRNFYTIPTPPLLPIVVAFILGIITQASYAILLPIIACLLLCQYITKTNLFFGNIIPMMLASCALGSFLLEKNLHDHYEFQKFINKSPITLQGTIINKNKLEKRWLIIEVAIDTIQKNEKIISSNKSALLYSENDTDLQVGDYCTFNNLKCSFSDNKEYNNYLIKEQVALIAFDKQFSYSNIERPYWSLRRLIHTHKTRLLDSLKNKLSRESFRFFSSLFLGNRSCVKTSIEKTNEQFKVWGISHFLARSGLHLALFVAVWLAILSCIPISFGIKQLILTIFSVIYFALTWTSAPFTRAFALLVAHKLFLYTKVPFNLLHALSCVCLCFLIYCPLYVFFLDFQLSFTLTFALAWFNQLSSTKY